jgi:hypothetical protein
VSCVLCKTTVPASAFESMYDEIDCGSLRADVSKVGAVERLFECMESYIL